MAKTSNIVTEWGQAANTSNSGYGAGANNTIGWGSVHANSSGHDRTDLVGVPSVYVGNSETVDGSGDPTGGTAQLFYRNRIEARPLWNTRQNLLTYSEDFSNADWVKSAGGTGSAPVVTGTNEIFFDAGAGTTSSDLSLISQSYIKVAGQAYTTKIRIKGAVGGEELVFRGASVGAFTKITLTTEYQEFELTENGNVSGLNTAFDLGIRQGLGGIGTINSSATVFIEYAQHNEGDTADEYVKTEANAYSFKGDETQLNDYSASNNGGQIYSGGALSFDGVNDWVNAGDICNFTTNFTLESWSEANTVSSDILVAKSDPTTDNRSYTILIDSSTGGLRVIIDATGFNVTRKIYTTSDSVVGIGKFHWAVTFAPNDLKIYINGIEANIVKSEDDTVNAVASNSENFAIGSISTGTGNYFDGDLIEVRAYNTTLTASEVLQNYNNPQQPIIDGLEVWYDFNELNGGTLFDRSGNGYNATINGATWVSGVKEGFQPAQSGFNNYQTFDGSDDSVTLASNIFNGLTSFTIKGKIAGANSSMILDERDSFSDGVSLSITNGNELTFRLNTSVVNAVTLLSETDINEFEARYNGSNVVFVVNGVEEAPQAIAEVISTSVSPSISKRAYTASSFFSGIIDYVEVEGVGRWSNLGGWVDEIGSNDGTVNGSPVSARIAGAEFNSQTDVFSNTIQNAYIANALNFSGGFSGLYVDAGANVDTSGAFSFAGWVYVNGSSGYDIWANRTTGDGMALRTVDQGNGTFDLFYINEDGGVAQTAASEAQNYETWYFIASTKDASGNTNLWWGTKTTAPVNKTDTANTDTGTSGAGTENMTFLARPTGTPSENLNGYLIYPLMYTEDLSTANTDLAPIEQIWDATKSLIPS